MSLKKSPVKLSLPFEMVPRPMGTLLTLLALVGLAEDRVQGPR